MVLTNNLQPINFIQANLMKSWNALDDLITYGRSAGLDIALVSEPPTTHGRMVERKYFKIVQHNCLSSEGRNKAAILIFN